MTTLMMKINHKYVLAKIEDKLEHQFEFLQNPFKKYSLLNLICQHFCLNKININSFTIVGIKENSSGFLFFRNTLQIKVKTDTNKYLDFKINPDTLNPKFKVIADYKHSDFDKFHATTAGIHVLSVSIPKKIFLKLYPISKHTNRSKHDDIITEFGQRVCRVLACRQKFSLDDKPTSYEVLNINKAFIKNLHLNAPILFAEIKSNTKSELYRFRDTFPALTRQKEEKPSITLKR